MLRRRHINADPRARSARFLGGVAELFRWPFERFAWALERGLLWPLRERFAGWSPSRRGAGGAALVAFAGVAILAVALFGSNDEAPREQVAVATPAAPAVQPPPRTTQQQGPALRGAAPSFAVGKGVGVSKAEDGGEAAAGSAASGAGTKASGATEPAEAGAGATTSATKPVPAGPAAMEVARRFSNAFVFYEIGERRARAKTVFRETATPQLASALGERPPRLPADAEVPKARVVNLVPGPRAGKAYTVSVSLLRVGLTSELRLELSKKNGAWTITDVRG